MVPTKRSHPGTFCWKLNTTSIYIWWVDSPGRKNPERVLSVRIEPLGVSRKMIRQYELVERIKAYDPGMNEDLVNRAYVYAMKMHGSQTRASGDPYFSHPLEVAGILTEMKMD